MRKTNPFLFPAFVLFLLHSAPSSLLRAERFRLGEMPDPTAKPDREKKPLSDDKSAAPVTDRKQTMDALVEENYRAGSNLMRQERFREAKVCFERALILSPDHRPSRENLRVINRLLEKNKAPSSAAAGTAVKKPATAPVKPAKKKPATKPTPKPGLSPEEARQRSAEIYLQALAATQNGKPDEALDLCQQALKLDPNNLQAERMCERLEARRDLR